MPLAIGMSRFLKMCVFRNLSSRKQQRWATVYMDTYAHTQSILGRLCPWSNTHIDRGRKRQTSYPWSQAEAELVSKRMGRGIHTHIYSTQYSRSLGICCNRWFTSIYGSYIRTHIWVGVYIYTHTHAHTHMYTHAHTYTHTYIYMYIM